VSHIKTIAVRGLGGAGLMLAALLCGCAVGPDFKRPEAPTAKSYAPVPLPDRTTDVPGETAQRFDPKKDIPSDWWTMFQSPQLNALIERAFKANPGIEAAQAALRQARQSVVAQQGYFYPTVQVGYSPSRNKIAGNYGGNSPGVQQNGDVIQAGSTTGAPPVSPAYYNFHVAQLSVGYVPDVFGGNARQVESLRAQEEGQRYQLEATYITLASNIVAAAVQEASLRAQIAATEKIVKANQEILMIMKKQQELGYESGIDVAGQESALAQAEQALVPLSQQLEQTRDLIRALAGNSPDQDVSETFTLESLHLPEELPLSLPSRIVEQRPDVRMAEAQLHSASAQYGVAISNRLPQFSINGVLGGEADSPFWMFKSGGGFFNLTGNVAQTIFDGGTLKARSVAAQEALKQAAAQYRSTVITALQNVADTLHAVQADADALHAAAGNERAQFSVRDITDTEYKDGFVSYQTLLAAELGYQQSLITLTQARSNRFGDTAALYQALGGGWWNRAEASGRKGEQTQ
jgi:NodT family efflux transporter outer membrane factor (OMF) lipoprotein